MENIGLNVAKCENFISQYPQFKEIFNLLFKHTKYYTIKNILDGITELTNKWLEERDTSNKLLIVVENDEIGSEIWFYNTIKSLLPDHTLIVTSPSFNLSRYVDIFNDYEGKYEILYLDDWCLSGNNKLGIFDSMLYAYNVNLNRQKFNNFIVTSINFLVTDRCNNIFRNAVLKPYGLKEGITYYMHIVDSLYTYLNELPSSVSTDTIIDFMIEFMPNISSDPKELPYPIHLEYKVANEFGSFPLLYKSCRDDIVKPYKSKEK